MKEKLKELQDKATEIRLLLSANLAEQKEIKIQLLFQKKGTKIGDKIKHRGEFGVINRCDGDYLYYNVIKKDGSVGVRESRIWSFDEFEVINP